MMKKTNKNKEINSPKNKNKNKADFWYWRDKIFKESNKTEEDKIKEAVEEERQRIIKMIEEESEVLPEPKNSMTATFNSGYKMALGNLLYKINQDDRYNI